MVPEWYVHIKYLILGLNGYEGLVLYGVPTTVSVDQSVIVRVHQHTS